MQWIRRLAIKTTTQHTCMTIIIFSVKPTSTHVFIETPNKIKRLETKNRCRLVVICS